MDEAVTAVIVPGLALGGVLAVAACWSRSARTGPLPHLAVGALAAVAVALGTRLDAAPAPLVFFLVVVAGGGMGRLARELDVRLPAGRAVPVPLSDVALLGGAIAMVGVLTPVGLGVVAVGPVGPLGGLPGTVGGLAAVVIGVGSAFVLVSARVAVRFASVLTPERRWGVAGGAVAASAVLASGALSPFPAAPELVMIVAADPVGLALRTVAAAVAGRGEAGEAAAAGLGLGFVEALLRAVDPSGVTAVLPAVAVAILGILASGFGAVRTPISAGPS